MANEERTASPALELEREPYRFSFFQALRILENLHPDKPRLGTSTRPADEPVRLAQRPSLGFAPSSIASYQTGKAGRPPRLTVNFLGLLGPNGPLPTHLTEYAEERIRHAQDPTFSRFLDVFHHRMLSLFYRAWANGQPAVGLDRPDEDRFGSYVGSLLGIGIPALQRRDEMPDLAKLHYAGHLGRMIRNAESLRSILSDFFALPVRIEEFVGAWIELPEAHYCRLGGSRAYAALGENAILGARVWECHHKFRIVLGPMDLAEYERFLPGSAALRHLSAITRNVVRQELAWDLKLILKRDEVPGQQLGTATRLGWTSWLPRPPSAPDADDLIFDPAAHADTPPIHGETPRPERPSNHV